jgi:hypothetical protein
MEIITLPIYTGLPPSELWGKKSFFLSGITSWKPGLIATDHNIVSSLDDHPSIKFHSLTSFYSSPGKPHIRHYATTSNSHPLALPVFHCEARAG